MKNLLPAVIICFCAAAAYSAQLVKDGQPAAEIILDTNAHASVKVAAEQIQKYIEKMSGAKLEIVSAPTGKYPARLYVGASAATKELGFTLDDVKHDGFKILARGNDVVVAGHDIDWYTEYGFSEENLDNVFRSERWPDRSGRWNDFTASGRSPMFILLRERYRSAADRAHPQIGAAPYGAFHRSNSLFPLDAPFQSLMKISKVIPEKKDIVTPTRNKARAGVRNQTTVTIRLPAKTP